MAVGRRADLILLDGNPLEDVANLRRRTGVMLRGRWLPATELQQKLDDLAASYQVNRTPSRAIRGLFTP